MSLATTIRLAAKQRIEADGEQITVTRRNADGSTTTLTPYCRPQPLTPTFVHRINEEALTNLDENDQRDFVIPGDVTMKDLDVITWDSHEWIVSTNSEQRLQGVVITNHALSVKKRLVAYGL